MHIYLFEDGQIGQHKHAPTELDSIAVKHGVLTVLKIEQDEVLELTGDDEWIPLPVCTIFDNGEGVCHVPSPEE